MNAARNIAVLGVISLTAAIVLGAVPLSRSVGGLPELCGSVYSPVNGGAIPMECQPLLMRRVMEMAAVALVGGLCLCASVAIVATKQAWAMAVSAPIPGTAPGLLSARRWTRPELPSFDRPDIDLPFPELRQQAAALFRDLRHGPTSMPSLRAPLTTLAIGLVALMLVSAAHRMDTIDVADPLHGDPASATTPGLAPGADSPDPTGRP